MIGVLLVWAVVTASGFVAFYLGRYAERVEWNKLIESGRLRLTVKQTTKSKEAGK